MRIVAAHLVYIALLVLAGNLSCTQSKIEGHYTMDIDNKSESVMETENKRESVVLTGEVKQEKDSVVILYELKNQSNEKILAWDLMIGYSGGEDIIDDNLAYVSFAEPHTARVVRAVLELPTDRYVYMKEIPYARSVDPGGSVTARIVLPVPIKEYNPYYDAPVPEDEKDAEISEIRLMVGWTEIRPGMVVTDTDVGGKNVKMIRGAWGRPLQRIAEKRFPVKSKMKVRTDAFDRRLPETK